MAGFTRGATPCVVGLLGGFHKPPNSAVGPRPDNQPTNTQTSPRISQNRPKNDPHPNPLPEGEGVLVKIDPKNPKIVNFLRYAFKSSEVIMGL